MADTRTFTVSHSAKQLANFDGGQVDNCERVRTSAVAQLVEHLSGQQRVAGSVPVRGVDFCSQMVT